MPLTLAHTKGNTTDLIESTIGQRLNQVAAAHPLELCGIFDRGRQTGHRIAGVRTEQGRTSRNMVAKPL